MDFNEYTNNLLIKNCQETWGERLEGLDLNGKMWLLADIIQFVGNPEEELSEVVVGGAMAIKGHQEAEGFALLQALTEMLDDSVCYELQDYLTNDWVEGAIEAYGSRLSEISLTEHSWIIYSLIQDLIKTEEISISDESALDDCSEWLENNGLTDQQELMLTVRTLGEIIYEQYQATPMSWERPSVIL